MRTAYHEVGFMHTDDTLQGFSMGFDFCAQHESSQPWLMGQLGIDREDFPQGVQARVATRVPETLQFFTYEHRAKDKRFKKSMPAAILTVRRLYGDSATLTPQEIARQCGASFSVECTDKRWYRPERDDIMSSWSAESGFAIHVRGEQNVEMLKRLHEAFLRKDIALGLGYIQGFKRQAPALVIASTLSDELRAQVAEADRAALALETAVANSGIRDLLKAAERGYHALSPSWLDEEGSELIFFLNPRGQDKYAPGWFSIHDLQEWAQEKGSVLDGKEIEPLLKKRDVDFGFHLVKGLNAQGIRTRTHETYVWLDPEKQKIGIRLRVTKDTQHLLTSGTYTLEQLQGYVDSGKALHEAETAAREAAKQAVAA